MDTPHSLKENSSGSHTCGYGYGQMYGDSCGIQMVCHQDRYLVDVLSALSCWERAGTSYSGCLVLSLPDHFCVGPDVIEVLWKLLILTASLGTCAFLIYLWRTILAVKPRQYEVTLDQIKRNIVELKKENKYLDTNIASWEEKIREAKKEAQRKREHKVSLAEINECNVRILSLPKLCSNNGN
ncbi:transport and Golgi organization protein 1 homolog, partial [Mustela erminea]|uniref:transport and Golgi organization protein 1 homolog n=1 Tax=Mustela erminea TaxID=36723 RepID=UPI001386A46C